MTLSRLLMPLALLLMTFSLSSACGKQMCSPTACKGCCGADGTCELGTTLTACGSGGAACGACMPAQVCAGMPLQCLGGGGTGSTDGGMGGGTGAGGGGGSTASSCITSTQGCPMTHPFSCAAATMCFATLQVCSASGQCPAGGGTGGGGGTSSMCNMTGVATNCPAEGPFSCGAATNCFRTYAECVNSGQC